MAGTCEVDVEAQDIAGIPVAAQLAPDEADMEAKLTEQLTTKITQEVEERLTTKITQEIEERARQMNSNIVVVAEAKAVSPHSSLKVRMMWSMTMLLLLVVGGGVAYWLVRKDKDAKKDTSPTIASDEPPQDAGTGTFSLDPLVVELRSLIAPSEEYLLPFMDSTSPQSKALAWLLEDKITLTYGRSVRTVLERYVLAVLYYSTLGPYWNFDYLSRNSVCTWNNGADIQNLTAPDDGRWLNLLGVFCSNDGESIDILALRDNNLHGSLPWELVLLTNLEYINLEMNRLSGSIPTRISELTNLEVFIVSQNNELTGTLPELFSPFTQVISVFGNKLTGTIPDSWGMTMPELTEVNVGLNSLTGTLPTSLGRLANLGTLWVAFNQLTGTIPSELGDLSSLWQMSVYSNSLTGSIDERLCLLPGLDRLEADCDVDCTCCTCQVG